MPEAGDTVYVRSLGRSMEVVSVDAKRCRVQVAKGALKTTVPLGAMAAHDRVVEPVLDAGPFVAALEYAAGVEAVLLGKPSPEFFGSVLAEMGLGAGEALMVGDDFEADVGGAQAAGIPGILVRTGKYRRGDEGRAGIRPDAILGSIAELPDWLTPGPG